MSARTRTFLLFRYRRAQRADRRYRKPTIPPRSERDALPGMLLAMLCPRARRRAQIGRAARFGLQFRLQYPNTRFAQILQASHQVVILPDDLAVLVAAVHPQFVKDNGEAFKDPQAPRDH